MDCIYTDSPTNQPHRVYAELKTNRIITSERQRENFERFKLLRVWAQSYLAGVSKVIVGFRDDAGTLKTVERFNTSEIPRFVRDKGLWDPHVCIGFTAKVLEWLQGELDGVDDAHEVYRLKSTNGSELELEGPLNDHPSFLPSWWIDELKGDSV